ncbi:NAD(P)-binding protein, partial [bacterium]|nr:NAD(P)-binding protein [bacterium]
MVRKISDTGIKPTTIIFGAGLAGLSAGFALVRAGQKVVMLESSSVVGGLART